jgi:uncharacterized protein
MLHAEIQTVFTPWASLAGGALIGLAAVLLMVLLGKVAGVTGILRGAVLTARGGERRWRLAMVLGMVSAPLAYLLATGALPVVESPAGLPLLVLGGLLAGVGVTLGNGCTSGHGVCGLARLSPRSLAATLSFMAAALVTVFVIRHLIGG